MMTIARLLASLIVSLAAFDASLHDELALLVDAGLTPLEALRSATWNPAEFPLESSAIERSTTTK